MPTTTRRSREGVARRRPVADHRDKAPLAPHNRALLADELPGLPRDIATDEDPVILAGVVATWLDSEEATDGTE